VSSSSRQPGARPSHSMTYSVSAGHAPSAGMGKQRGAGPPRDERWTHSSPASQTAAPHVTTSLLAKLEAHAPAPGSPGRQRTRISAMSKVCWPSSVMKPRPSAQSTAAQLGGVALQTTSFARPAARFVPQQLGRIRSAQSLSLEQARKSSEMLPSRDRHGAPASLLGKPPLAAAPPAARPPLAAPAFVAPAFAVPPAMLPPLVTPPLDRPPLDRPPLV
jgi:hypothetical protein